MGEFSFFKNFIFDPIFSLLYFPLWWYSKGLINFCSWLKEKIQEMANPFVLKILLLNLAKPMYGDYTREGRIISFFMRIIHLGWRLIRVFFISFFGLIFLIIYLFILPLIFYKIICLFGEGNCYFLPGEII